MPSRTNTKVKGWFLTYAQVTGTKEQLLQHLQNVDTLMEYCVCRERHEDGNTHFHAYCKYAEGVCPRDVLQFKWGERTAHAQAARSVRAVLKYIKKDGDYISNIENIEEVLGQKHRKRNRELMEMGATSAVEEGFVPMQAYKQLKMSMELYKLDTACVLHTGEVKGVWIYGPAGAGKSHYALRKYPGAFQKACNKWWDGYQGEDYVIMDDLRRDRGKMLVWFLCRWMDKWAPPPGEVKGGTIPLPFTKFIVTSQWAIRDMFEETEDYEAVRRRCREVRFEDRHPTVRDPFSMSAMLVAPEEPQAAQEMEDWIYDSDELHPYGHPPNNQAWMPPSVEERRRIERQYATNVINER